MTEHRAHERHRAIARPWDGRGRTTAGRARRDPLRGTGRAGEGSAALRRYREAQLTHAIGESSHASPGPDSTASFWWVCCDHRGDECGESSGALVACQALSSRRQGFTATLGRNDAIRCDTMPRTRHMARIHLIAGSIEIARRRRLVPAGHLVEAWQDLRIPDRFWVGDEAKALLDATGAPCLPSCRSMSTGCTIFYGARLDHIESLPTSLAPGAVARPAAWPSRGSP